MTASLGLVSVVIPVFNGERFLRAAIDSVLTQGYRPIEVVVVNDGSTDGTAAILSSYGPAVRVVQQDNAGLGAARNAGVSASLGDLLAFLDADDLWTEDKLTHQVSHLVQRPDLDGVFGLVDHFFEEGAEAFNDNVDQGAPGLSAPALLIHRKSFLKAGFFTTERGLGEFIEWYTRAVDEGLRFEVLDRVVLKRRIHGGNMTLQHREDRTGYLRVLRATLTRRRGQ
jgi:glycosyltransferase involved in cell wall biosynthesis